MEAGVLQGFLFGNHSSVISKLHVRMYIYVVFIPDAVTVSDGTSHRIASKKQPLAASVRPPISWFKDVLDLVFSYGVFFFFWIVLLWEFRHINLHIVVKCVSG